MFLSVNDIKKSFGEKDNIVQVLNGISLSLESGKICVILGSSGCGKSTLLNCIGGLDTVDSGSIVIDGKNISMLDSKKVARFRRDYLGFVFQGYNLIPNLTVEENIEVCKYLTKSPLDIEELLDILGLNEHRKKFPNMLSGGQQQRTAIARAIIKSPKLLLCDEPTGALDSKSAREILGLIERINKKYNTTILLVTHNLAISPMADQVVLMRDGLIENITYNQERKAVAELEGL